MIRSTRRQHSRRRWVSGVRAELEWHIRASRQTDTRVLRFVPVQGQRFDVFLCHHGADDAVVEHLAERLRGEEVQPWLDLWCLAPGDNWQQEIGRGLRAAGACAVFVGPHGLGDWAREELAVAQDRAAKDRDFRLFLVLLPGAAKPDDPSLDFLANRHWVDLRPGIDDPTGFQSLLAAISGVPRGPAAIAAAGDSVCPYRGLDVFEEEHAEFFFGRDDDTRRLIERLKDSRFLAVLGPSGCGKSSLVRAGVTPALKEGALPGSEGWTVRLITPGARPLSRLAAELARLLSQESTLDALDRLRTDERTLDLVVGLALGDRPDDERMVLVVGPVRRDVHAVRRRDRARGVPHQLVLRGHHPGRTPGRGGRDARRLLPPLRVLPPAGGAGGPPVPRQPDRCCRVA